LFIKPYNGLFTPRGNIENSILTYDVGTPYEVGNKDNIFAYSLLQPQGMHSVCLIWRMNYINVINICCWTRSASIGGEFYSWHLNRGRWWCIDLPDQHLRPRPTEPASCFADFFIILARKCVFPVHAMEHEALTTDYSCY
jgi:hypothetical protein